MKRRPTPTDIRFDEIHRILTAYGFIQKTSSGGSHYVYEHPELEYKLTIAKDSKVKKGYVRETIKAIEIIRDLYEGELF